jgi:hypothetical protein
MACTNGTKTYVNIKELPEISDINNGDFLIVETTNGTTILDYQNFLVTLDNTTFADQITTNTTNIVTLSTDLASLSSSSATVSQFNTLNSAVTAQFNTLNSAVTALTSTTATDTYAVFSLSGYNNNGLKLLRGSNIYSLQVNQVSPSLSSVKITFNNRFLDSNYGYTINTQLSTIAGPDSLSDITTDYINIYIKDRFYNNNSLTERATIRIVGGQTA